MRWRISFGGRWKGDMDLSSAGYPQKSVSVAQSVPKGLDWRIPGGRMLSVLASACAVHTGAPALGPQLSRPVGWGLSYLSRNNPEASVNSHCDNNEVGIVGTRSPPYPFPWGLPHS